MTLADLVEKQVSGVRAGVHELRVDLTAVHDSRVALRRLRATLSVFAELLEGVPPELPGDLRWFARQVGATRDVEVVAARLEGHLGSAADLRAAQLLGEALRHRAEEAEAAARAALADPRTDAMLTGLRGLHTVATPADEPAQGVRAHLLVLRSLDALCVDLPAALATAAEPGVSRSRRARVLHAQRKQVKTGRAVTSLLATSPEARSGLNRSLRQVQDLLGEHHDAVVTRAWLAQVAAREPVVGDLVRAVRRQERAELDVVEGQLPWAVGRVLARVDRVRRTPAVPTVP